MLLLLPLTAVNAQNLKPYILAGTESGDITAAVEKTEKLLEKQGFTVAGKYSPMGDDNRVVICITSEALKNAAKSSDDIRMFAAVLRVGVHYVGTTNNISFMNPLYWGNAYYQKEFGKVSKQYDAINAELIAAFKGLSNVHNMSFGSKNGKTPKDLQGYRYKFMMPHFDDIDELVKDSSYEEILKVIDGNFSSQSALFEKVYDVRLPGQKLALIGVGLKGEKGETNYIPKIDKEELKYLPFAPYELLVMEDKAIALRARYRIAVSFPDLSMGTFMKISGAPGDIKDYLIQLVGGEQ
jgi:hypothetical protein